MYDQWWSWFLHQTSTCRDAHTPTEQLELPILSASTSAWPGWVLYFCKWQECDLLSSHPPQLCSKPMLHSQPENSLACSRLSDSRGNEKNCLWKASGGLGRGEAGEPVSISLNSSFWYTSSWYTLWLVNFDSLHQHFPHHFDARSLRGARKKVVNSVAECLKVFPNVQALRFEQNLCLLTLSGEEDPFAMLPTRFGKSINFQLLPRIAKALQCCDTTSLHTAYNIASPGTIYALNFIAHTQLLCPLHGTIVSIRRRSLITLTNEKKYNIMLFFRISYANTWQGIWIHQLRSIKFLPSSPSKKRGKKEKTTLEERKNLPKTGVYFRCMWPLKCLKAFIKRTSDFRRRRWWYVSVYCKCNWTHPLKISIFHIHYRLSWCIRAEVYWWDHLII